MAKKEPTLEIFKGDGNAGRWYWRLRAKNGEVACQSEGYKNKASAYRAAKRLPKLVEDACLKFA